MQPIYKGKPFKRGALYIFGPLPRTERGNRYILTVVDHFTKQGKAYSLYDLETVLISRVFLNVCVEIWRAICH